MVTDTAEEYDPKDQSAIMQQSKMNAKRIAKTDDASIVEKSQEKEELAVKQVPEIRAKEKESIALNPTNQKEQ